VCIRGPTVPGFRVYAAGWPRCGAHWSRGANCGANWGHMVRLAATGGTGRATVGAGRGVGRHRTLSWQSRSQAPSAGHRPCRAGRVKGGAVRGPRAPHSTVAPRCPPGTLDPTATTSEAARTRKPGRSRARATHTPHEDPLRSVSRSDIRHARWALGADRAPGAVRADVHGAVRARGAPGID
jgi:hypothetical protein